jgi:hypothetical protein
MIPLFRYECQTWSDGEEHPDEDHNAAYDFNYFVLERDGLTLYCCSTEIVFLFELSESEAQHHAIVDHCSFQTLERYLKLKSNEGHIKSEQNARFRKAVDHFMSRGGI